MGGNVREAYEVGEVKMPSDDVLLLWVGGGQWSATSLYPEGSISHRVLVQRRAKVAV